VRKYQYNLCYNFCVAFDNQSSFIVLIFPWGFVLRLYKQRYPTIDLLARREPTPKYYYFEGHISYQSFHVVTMAEIKLHLET